MLTKVVTTLATSESQWTSSNLKPMSVNEAWMGKKTKSVKYRKYEAQLLRSLPDIELPDTKLFEIRLVVYYSSKLSDLDNAAKPFIDCLCKRYGFDDRYIYRIRMTKVIVPKGKENIQFRILPFTPNGETTNGNAKG
ncbi:hypothetical protein [Amphritea sp. HPY]|uniref:hypothetical protein n=1 Tax=Amphritea sp. HPY TaxID=3421652 RepID=UPI003D7EF910